MGDITAHFSELEFTCPCCSGCKLDLELVNMLEKARCFANIPFVVTSGYRCLKHNKAINGSKNSAHLKGEAADIRIRSSIERWLVIKALLDVGFERIGIGSTFIHADMNKEKAQKVIWVY